MFGLKTKNIFHGKGFIQHHFLLRNSFIFIIKIFSQNKHTKKSLKSGAGFTLIELLVVIAIVGLLSSIMLVALTNARESARKAAAVETVRQLQKALEIYITDVGYYPPDVARGWDPGISRVLPYDTTGSGQDCNITQASCVCNLYLSCTGANPPNIPSDWITQTKNHWRGPYTIKWPVNTPWGGTYDYNFWDTGADRGPGGTCHVPPGIYLGIESGSGYTLDANTEQSLYNQGIDNDGCPNDGEVQILLVKL